MKAEIVPHEESSNIRVKVTDSDGHVVYILIPKKDHSYIVNIWAEPEEAVDFGLNLVTDGHYL